MCYLGVMHILVLRNLPFFAIATFLESVYFMFDSYRSFFQSPVLARLNNFDRELESPERDKDKVKVLDTLLHRVVPKTKYSGMSKVPV